MASCMRSENGSVEINSDWAKGRTVKELGFNFRHGYNNVQFSSGVHPDPGHVPWGDVTGANLATHLLWCLMVARVSIRAGETSALFYFCMVLYTVAAHQALCTTPNELRQPYCNFHFE
jgi:hypothetical protein